VGRFNLPRTSLLRTFYLDCSNDIIICAGAFGELVQIIHQLYSLWAQVSGYIFGAKKWGMKETW
jgi:hypothetical protein